MSDIVPTEAQSETSAEDKTDREFLERTKRWVDERSLPTNKAIRHPQLAMRLYWERNARKQIYGDIQRDVQTNGLQNPLTPELVAQKGVSIGEISQVVSFRDTLTDEPFYQILRREGESLIAEERKNLDLSSDVNLISQARLGPQGQTELTLNFTGERFQIRNANPDITHSNRFPNATVRIFDTLSRSIEQSSKNQPISAKPS